MVKEILSNSFYLSINKGEVNPPSYIEKEVISNTFYLNINKIANRPPTITNLDYSLSERDCTITFDIHDEDNDQMNVYLIKNNQEELILSNQLSGSKTITLYNLPNGITTLSLRVSDGSLDCRSETISIEIKEVVQNRPPIITNLKHSLSGKNCTITFNVHDEDNDQLNIYLTRNSKEELVLRDHLSGNKTITVNNLSVGSHIMSLRVSDGKLNTYSDTFRVTVEEEIINNPPTISNVQVNKTNFVGVYELEFEIQDVDNDKMDVYLKVGNSNYEPILVNQSNGVKQYKGQGLSAGNHTCFIKVSDGKQEVVSNSFNIRIPQEASNDNIFESIELITPSTIKANTPTRVAIKLKSKANIDKKIIHPKIKDIGNKVKIYNAQWEKGSVLTDWRESVSEISSKTSELSVNLDGITSSVSAIEDKTTILDGKVASQEIRLATAEQKITPSAITSVVQSANFVKDMNGKINTNASNISKVEQTANSITNRVEALDGKYTEIKQTVDGIDVTGKVSFSDLSTAGKTTIHGGNIKTDTLSVNSLKSNNDNPVIKLFPNSNGYCSIDATKQYETGGKGSYVRLKWDKYNYWYVGNNTAGVYLGRTDNNAEGQEYDSHFWVSTTHARVKPNKFMIGNGDCRIDTNGGAIRLYTTPDGGLDRGLRINSSSGRLDIRQSDLTFTNVDNGTYKTVAWSDHTHSNYASTSHTHSDYAPSSHSHDEISYGSYGVEAYSGYVYFRAGSATIRLDNGTNQTSSYGGAYKLVPTTNGIDLGSSTNTWTRWRTVYAQNSLNTSDIKCKEDIHYLDDNIARFGKNNTPFLDFIKNDFRPATYMYKAMREEEGHVDADRQIGFIANDIIDTEVGKTFLYNFGTEEETDIMFSPTGYTTVVARALQEEIKRREELEAKCVDLEERLIKLEKILESKL